MAKVPVWQFSCERCKEKWIPRDATSAKPKKPLTCPKCKSPYWDVPRKSDKLSNSKGRAKR